MEKKTFKQLIAEIPEIVASVRDNNFDDARAQTIEDLACWYDKQGYDLTDDEHELLSDALYANYCRNYDD